MILITERPGTLSSSCWPALGQALIMQWSANNSQAFVSSCSEGWPGGVCHNTWKLGKCHIRLQREVWNDYYTFTCPSFPARVELFYVMSHLSCTPPLFPFIMRQLAVRSSIIRRRVNATSITNKECHFVFETLTTVRRCLLCKKLRLFKIEKWQKLKLVCFGWDLQENSDCRLSITETSNFKKEVDEKKTKSPTTHLNDVLSRK